MKLFKGNSLEWKHAGLAVVLTLSTFSFACNDASAMGRKNRDSGKDAGSDIVVPAPPAPVVPAPAPDPVVVVPVPAPVPVNPAPAVPVSESAGTYGEGYELGKRNGGIIVDRLRTRTVGVEGCAGVHKLQEGLIAVTRSIRPPQNSDDRMVRGFFRGYLDAVREGVAEARTGCRVRRFTDGLFAGTLYGNLLCQVSTVSVVVATELEVQSLYGGWSGGSADVLKECRTAAEVVLRDCGSNDLTSLLSVNVEQSCSDVEVE